MGLMLGLSLIVSVLLISIVVSMGVFGGLNSYLSVIAFRKDSRKYLCCKSKEIADVVSLSSLWRCRNLLDTISPRETLPTHKVAHG